MARPDVIQHPSPNFGPRKDGKTVDMLIIHYTDMASAEEALALMCDEKAQVSAHYLIGRDGTVWQLVDDEMRAWHAGVSFWQGETDINSRSIGIELDNPGHRLGYEPFPEEQMIALRDLCRDLDTRFDIPATRVLGHSDVAPGRKIDPGELFDWKWMAYQGIGIWPGPLDPDIRGASEKVQREAFSAIGYEGANTRLEALWDAYHRHWAPDQVRTS